MCFSASAQEKTVKKVTPKPTVSLDGKTLFNQYCAVCHGQDGKGSGPAADALKQNPTDLTQISHKNHGTFPEQQIMAGLKGGGPKAHGSTDMPIWGPIFNNMSNNLTLTQTRMHALVNYLESIQAK